MEITNVEVLHIDYDHPIPIIFYKIGDEVVWGYFL